MPSHSKQNAQRLFNRLLLQPNKKNTISAEDAAQLVKKCHRHLSEECMHKNEYNPDNKILFYSIYHNELHVFIEVLKYYTASGDSAWLSRTVDEFDFNLLHKIAFKGSIEYFNALLEQVDHGLLRTGFFTSAIIIDTDSPNQENGSSSNRASPSTGITPLDILLFYNHSKLLNRIIKSGIISQSVIEKYFSHDPELYDHIKTTELIQTDIEAEKSRATFDEMLIKKASEPANYRKKKIFSLETWLQKIELYTSINPSFTDALEFAEKSSKLQKFLFPFSRLKDETYIANITQQIYNLLEDQTWQPSLIMFYVIHKIIHELEISLNRTKEHDQFIRFSHDVLFNLTGEHIHNINNLMEGILEELAQVSRYKRKSSEHTVNNILTLNRVMIHFSQLFQSEIQKQSNAFYQLPEICAASMILAAETLTDYLALADKVLKNIKDKSLIHAICDSILQSNKILESLINHCETSPNKSEEIEKKKPIILAICNMLQFMTIQDLINASNCNPLFKVAPEYVELLQSEAKLIKEIIEFNQLDTIRLAIESKDSWIEQINQISVISNFFRKKSGENSIEAICKKHPEIGKSEYFKKRKKRPYKERAYIYSGLRNQKRAKTTGLQTSKQTQTTTQRTAGDHTAVTTQRQTTDFQEMLSKAPAYIAQQILNLLRKPDEFMIIPKSDITNKNIEFSVTGKAALSQKDTPTSGFHMTIRATGLLEYPHISSNQSLPGITTVPLSPRNATDTIFCLRFKQLKTPPQPSSNHNASSDQTTTDDSQNRLSGLGV